jgi:Fic family protein
LVQALQGTSLEERVALLNELVKRAPQEMLADYRDRLDMSWIYHDSALEGVVFTMEELGCAISEQSVNDSSLIPVYDEIRQHKAAIAHVRELADKARLKVTLEVIKKIYAHLAPEEMEGKGGPRYRKEIPLHRLYFHDIAPPDKISYRMRQLIQWMNAADTKRSTHAVRLAAKAHYQLLHIYPFPKHSGKVARLVMNLILLRSGYPPAVIHATERQRYYEALKSSENAAAAIVHEALVASVESAVRFFEGDAASSSDEIKSA